MTAALGMGSFGEKYVSRSKRGCSRKKDGSLKEYFYDSTVSFACLGNHCGHDPKNPRLLSLVNPHNDQSADVDDFGHKRKSHFFYDFDRVMDDFYFYPKILPSLGMHYHDGNRTSRRRSEAREADVAVLKVLVHHLDLSSRRFGYPDKGGFVYYNIKFIMKRAGLSKSRVKRSLGRLVKSGYIERTRRWTERDFGKFKALTTATRFNDSFFNALGLLDKFKATADFYYQRLKQRAAEIGVTVSSMLQCSVEAVKTKQKVVKSMQDKPEDFPEDDSRRYTCQLNEEQRRVFSNTLSQIAMNTPEMSKTMMYLTAFKAAK